MPMLMMLAMTLMDLPDALDDVAYGVANDLSPEAKMSNVARHLASANVVLVALS